MALSRAQQTDPTEDFLPDRGQGRQLLLAPDCQKRYRRASTSVEVIDVFPQSRDHESWPDAYGPISKDVVP